MGFDADLADRMRKALQARADFSEKRMMGGICFFLHGNMICGADRSKEGQRRFMFRVGKSNAPEAAVLGAVSPMTLGNRVMPGFYFVDSECDDTNLGSWLELSLSYARSFPPK